MSDLEKLLLITISFEMCMWQTPVVEYLNLSLRQLARADLKSLHQQRARGNETIWSLLNLGSKASCPIYLPRNNLEQFLAQLNKKKIVEYYFFW